MRVNFETDNAEFEGVAEIGTVRLLRTIANNIELGKTAGRVMDANGNAIGYWDCEVDA